MTIDAVRDALVWLGNCKRIQTEHSTHLVFKFSPETSPNTTLRLKVEINTREHKNLYGIKQYPFQFNSSWYKANTKNSSFEPDEFLGQSFVPCCNEVRAVTCSTCLKGSGNFR